MFDSLSLSEWKSLLKYVWKVQYITVQRQNSCPIPNHCRRPHSWWMVHYCGQVCLCAMIEIVCVYACIEPQWPLVKDFACFQYSAHALIVFGDEWLLIKPATNWFGMQSKWWELWKTPQTMVTCLLAGLLACLLAYEGVSETWQTTSYTIDESEWTNKLCADRRLNLHVHALIIEFEDPFNSTTSTIRHDLYLRERESDFLWCNKS